MNRKFTAFLTSATMLLTTCACGEKNTGGSEISENIPLPVTQTLYKEESLAVPEDYYSFEHMEYAENLDSHYIIYDDFSGNIKVCIMDSDFNIKSTEILCENGNITECMYDISPDGEISQLKYTCDYDYPENNEFDEQDYIENAVLSFELAIYDSNGKFISETPIEGMEKYYSLLESRTNELLKTGDTYIANLYTSLVKFDSDGKILDTVKSDKGIGFIGMDNSGKLAGGEFKTLSFYKENSLEQTEETIETTGYLNIGGSLRRGTNGYRMYMRMNEGYFGLTDNGEFVKILDFTKSNIISSEIYEICIGSEGHIMMFGQNASGMQYISKLTVRPDDYVENKQTVILASVDGFYDDKRQLITEFNKKSDEYKIEIKSYESYDDFKKDLISGNSPDLLVYNSSSVMYDYANTEVFLNMYDFTDKYGGFSKDDICGNVLNAFEYKGGLYGICSNYHIMTFVANSEVVGKEYTNWSYDDMFKITENMPDGMTFSSNESLNNRTEVFNWFGAYNTRGWIDYENASCSFDSEKFIKFLNFCQDVPMLPERDYSSMTMEEQELSNQETHAMLKNKKALLVNEYIVSLGSLDALEQTRLMNIEDMTITGLPTDNHCGIISANDIYSIVANGNCPEGAWEYINYIMSKEYQDNVVSQFHGQLVSRKDSFERGINLYQTPPPESNDPFYHTYYSPLSDEALKDFLAYLEKCNTLIYQNGYVTYIMDEEFNEFINGAISAEECANRIQSRVSIYLAEKQ